MRIETVRIRVFEEGDRVLTPSGEGTIISDNLEMIGDLFYNDLGFRHEVIVQHDEGYSDNPGNEPVEMDAALPSLL